MTKRTVTTKRRGTKAKPANGIERAAGRSGIKPPTGYVAPWPADPSPGRTLRESLKACEWPGDHAEILRRFARDFEQTAIEMNVNRKEAERAERAANPNLNAWKHTGTAFDGGEDIDAGATAADMIGLVFEAPNRGDFGRGNLLRDVLLSVADEVELIGEAMQSDFLNKDALARWALRTTYRVRVAVEADKRSRATEGGAS